MSLTGWSSVGARHGAQLEPVYANTAPSKGCYHSPGPSHHHIAPALCLQDSGAQAPFFQAVWRSLVILREFSHCFPATRGSERLKRRGLVKHLLAEHLQTGRDALIGCSAKGTSFFFFFFFFMETVSPTAVGCYIISHLFCGKC